MNPQQMLRIDPWSIKREPASQAGSSLSADCPRAGSPHRRGQRPLALAALAAAGLCYLPAVAGCGRTLTSTPVNIVVLASATRNEPAPALAPPDLSLLRDAAASSADATAFVVNPSTGQSYVVSLTPRRPDGEVDYGPDRDRRIRQNVHRVEVLLRKEAAQGPFDLLAEIVKATRVVATPGTLIIVSSGLSVAGGFDLRQVNWGANPRALVTQLKQRDLLPDLAGWRVVLSGLADTWPPQPPLPLPQQTELASYWLAICHAAGALSCLTDDITRPTAPPDSTTPVPVVPVPAVLSVGNKKIIPADAFFAYGSAKLLPGADLVLAPLAAEARQQHLDLSITGYASPDGGSAAFNKRLSLRRATAIGDRLIALGAPRRQIVSVTGKGTAGQTPSACYRGGHLDEAICSRLRRVVIVLRQMSPVSN